MIALCLLQVPTAGPTHIAPRLGPDPVVRFFVTNVPSPAFAKTTVRLSRLVLIGAGGDRVVFRAKPGRAIEVGALSESVGRRYEFVSRNVIPNGVYDGLRVELEGGLDLGPTPAKFAGTKFGFKMLTVEFPAPRRLDSNRNVAITFDLSKWAATGSEVVVRTETDPDTKRPHLVGVTADDRVAEAELQRQTPVSLSGFVTGPIGRPPGPLTGVRQEGWILPVKFPAARPKRGAIVRIFGTFSVALDAFVASDSPVKP